MNDDLSSLRRNLDRDRGRADSNYDNCLEALKQRRDASDDMRAADRVLLSQVNPNHPPADLILLINPAVEALSAKSMAEALEHNDLIQLNDTTTNQAKPWIISISSHGGWFGSSAGDWLTDKLFPFGRTFSSTLKQFRNYDYTNAMPTFRDAVCQSRRLPATRDLQFHRPDQEKFFLHTAPQLEDICNRTIVTNTVDANPIFGETNYSRIIAANSGMKFADSYGFYTTNDLHSMLVIKPKPSKYNNSSYWVINVDPSIIPDHGNIFRPNVIAIATGLYRMSQASKSGTNVAR